MIQKNLLWICLAICWNITSMNAQEFIWAKNKVNITGRSSLGIVSDNLGNIYDYGTTASPNGSYVTKYNSSGSLLVNKVWTDDFFINDLKLDNTNRLFFTGYFKGTVTLDGVTMVSRGEQDVVVGELNSQGNILAVKTFGGRKDDFSYGLAIDNVLGKLLITGGVQDSVYINNVLTPRQTQSMFIASYTKALVFSGIQYFDFIPQLNDPYEQNMGKEIVLGNSGDLYLLHNREGQDPHDGPPYTYPLSGIYVMKINNTGTILWSQRIIGNESEYGYGVSRLRVNNIGDAFLIKFSAGKYGGSGTVLRLNNTTGTTTWSYSQNPDNYYRDILIDNTNSLILIGEENWIPYGETGTYGNDILKKFDQNNNLVWEKKLYDIQSMSMTLDNQQNIYLAGFLGDTSTIGTNILYRTNGAEFIAKLTNPGVAPIITTGAIGGSPLNPGAYLTVPFTQSAPFSSGNLFTAQLSDANGNFQNATLIGSAFALTLGSVNSIIPLTTPPGTHYRIRVIGSNPLRYGSDNGTDLTILSNQMFINSNAAWKFLDNGTNQGTAWIATSFNDAAWKNGNTQLGYGDGDENTAVSYGPNSSNKYITTYFRNTFTVSNPSQFSSFELSLLKDDGAVVYINGVEVLRSNMSSGTISYTSLASSSLDAPAENQFTTYTIASSKFINGNNTVAVEVHQSSVTSSDLSFTLILNAIKPFMCSATGTISREHWANITGKEVSLIPVNTAPTSTSMLTSFEGPSNVGDNYGDRIRGFVCPPYTGNYTFWIASDDNSELWLSTNYNPTNKVKIAFETGWALPRDWSKFPSQKSASIYLIAGNKYYIEALHKEDVQGDNIAVGWQLPNGTFERPIPGNRISPYTTVPPIVTCSATGTITREVWTNITGTSISAIPVSTTPNSTGQLTIFEAPSNFADNYGQRIRGYACPPITGNYIFWIASDDNSELWLSTNDNPLNKIKIASSTGWTASRQWTKYPSQQSAAIYLIAGQKYYIEALHKDGTMGDNCAVGWQLPSGVLERPIPGIRLSPYDAIPPAPSIGLISAGSSWKCLDNGTNQGTAWRTTSFSDATWKTGNAEFGYGDGGEATVLSYGPSATNKYITTYFRKTFNVTDISTISGLELSLIRDDGAVVYINGIEVYRSNLPAGTIYYNTLAPGYIDGTAESTYVVATISSSSLVNGTNTIAVEIHQNAVTSSDISFNLKLKTLSGAKIMDTPIDAIQEQEIVSDNKYDMLVYPNPSNGQFNLELCVDNLQEKKLVIEVTNSLGQVVYTDEPKKINGCVREVIELDASIPSGVYLLKVSIDDKIEAKNMLLVR